MAIPSLLLLEAVKASPVHLRPIQSERITNPKPQYRDVTRVLKEVVQAKQTIWILLTKINVRIYTCIIRNDILN